MKLVINFLEGFFKDSVTITLNGKDIFSGVITTQTQVGFAYKQEVEIHNPKTEIVVEIANKNLRNKLNINITEKTYIGYSVTGDNQLVNKIQNKPFFFL